MNIEKIYPLIFLLIILSILIWIVVKQLKTGRSIKVGESWLNKKDEPTMFWINTLFYIFGIIFIIGLFVAVIYYKFIKN